MCGEIDLFAGFKIAALARKIGASIIHCHTAQAHAYGVYAKALTNIKLVVTRRVDFPLKSGNVSIWKYRRADQIIAISNRIRDILIKSGIDQGKIEYVPSGVKFDKLIDWEAVNNLKNKLQLKADQKIIGTIAALVGHKDYPTLLKAFAEVLKHHPETVLLALGEGDDLNRLMSIAKHLNIEKKVQFLGFRDDVVNFFGLFDVYVQSSKMEGLCSSLIDAMYFKMPIAAAAAGGIPDLVEHGVTGLLSKPLDYQAMAGNIIDLLENKELADRVAGAAHKKSLGFSADNMIEGTEKVYLRLLEE